METTEVGGSSARSGTRDRVREGVLESQRARILEAIAEVAAERGLRGATTAQVARRAGVSRGTLGARFPSTEDCFVALLDSMLERATSLIVTALKREPSWSRGVLNGLEAFLVLLDQEPVAARACLLETPTLAPTELRPRLEALERLGALVDERARAELSLERRPPRTMADATVVSVLGLLRRRLLNGEAPPFVPLLDQLAEAVVAPYLGPSAAARVAAEARERATILLEEHSVGRVRPGVEVPGLLRHGSAHRMRQCVRYIAENPGASNRAVGAGIEVSHAGQVSALLSRLRGAGLLEKSPGGAGRPNAWHLSTYGAAVAQALGRW